MGRLATAKFNR